MSDQLLNATCATSPRLRRLDFSRPARWSTRLSSEAPNPDPDLTLTLTLTLTGSTSLYWRPQPHHARQYLPSTRPTPTVTLASPIVGTQPHPALATNPNPAQAPRCRAF